MWFRESLAQNMWFCEIYYFIILTQVATGFNQQLAGTVSCSLLTTHIYGYYQCIQAVGLKGGDNQY